MSFRDRGASVTGIDGVMAEEKIEVAAYSGSRGEETPRSFVLHGERTEVVEILDLWIEEDSRGRSRKRSFRVKGNGGCIYKIYRDEMTGEWLCELFKPSSRTSRNSSCRSL